MANLESMKRHRFLFLSVVVVALLVGGCGLWVWQAKRQYALNRQLIAALVSNDSRQALALVNAGADPNTHYSPAPPPSFNRMLRQLLHHSPTAEDDSPTAFQIACGGEGYPQIVGENTGDYPENVPLIHSMFAHGANANVYGSYHESALHFAVDLKHFNTARFLLEQGMDVNQHDSDGCTSLMQAVMNDDETMTRLLVDHDAVVSIECLSGDTALHYAMNEPMNIKIIRLLLAHCADPYHKNKQGETPLMIAQQMERPDIVALLRKGAK